MQTPTIGQYKDRRYFSSTRNYTLALLNAFNGIRYWVETDDEVQQKEFTIPLSFGNYEKALTLQDMSETELRKGNFNFLPRLVLSFEGMTKAVDRQTNKFQKLTRRVYDPETRKRSMDVSYNSVAYDYQFTLLLQSRGLTITSQVVEEILVKFNPTLNLMINEFPIFEERTETQIQISDPSFEIQDEFGDEEVNIINVSFDIVVRGNIYSPISMVGPIEVVKMFTHIWDDANIEDAEIASYYRFDVNTENQRVYKETTRIFDATRKWSPEVEVEDEQTLIETRPDFHKYQTVMDFDEFKPTDMTNLEGGQEK
jgi:hypothetical protein